MKEKQLKIWDTIKVLKHLILIIVGNSIAHYNFSNLKQPAFQTQIKALPQWAGLCRFCSPKYTRQIKMALNYLLNTIRRKKRDTFLSSLSLCILSSIAIHPINLIMQIKINNKNSFSEKSVKPEKRQAN